MDRITTTTTISGGLILGKYYDVMFSPENQEKEGKPFFAEILNTDGTLYKSSGAFKTSKEAKKWAKARGGSVRLYGGA